MAEHQFKGRREDLRLVTGQGRYTTDHHLNGQVAAHFLRADRAHAKIVRIDIAEARKLPGVLDIVTGADIVAAGWKTPPVLSFFKGVGGSSVRIPFRPGLAHERVRFVGEPVAVVIAETEHLAQDAAELIEIEYEDLPVVVDASEALKASAPRVHEEMPDNLASNTSTATAPARSRRLPRRAHVIRVGVTRAAHRRQSDGAEVLPRALRRRDATCSICTARPRASRTSRRRWRTITGLDAGKFRVHSNDVGGGFGVRNEIYPEFLAVLLAAKRTGKAVRWTGTRSETISGDHHARAADLKGELAIDDKGKFLGLRVEWLVNLGAYCSGAGALINTVAAPTSSATSLYKVPAFYGRHRLVFTNTTPVTAYRGAGRPNVAYLWERLVEEAAATLGIDPVRLRRRNILPKSAFPMKTLTGHTYDSGDPARLLDTALEAADWDGFKARRKAAKKNGQLRGIGLAMFLEPSGAVGKEQIEIKIEPDGKLAMYSNAGPMGQGLETVLPGGRGEGSRHARGPDRAALQRHRDAEADRHRLVRLALADQPRRRADERRQGDRREGQGAGGQRARSVAERRDVRERRLQGGRHRPVDPHPHADREEVGPAEHPLDTNLTLDTAAAFPSGAHIAEVEIDPDTGAVQIVNYVAADDCGNVINHAIVEGQLHGGLMQGIGQVLGEHIAYDPDTGQLLSGTFMDYFMPRAAPSRADHADRLRRAVAGQSARRQGRRRGGRDRLDPGARQRGARRAQAVRTCSTLEMPYTPERVWQAIQKGA